MSQRTGIVRIKVNGKILEAKIGTRVKPGGNNRESVVANDDDVGYFETPMGSEVTVLIPVDDETDFDEIRGWKNVTLVIIPDAGPQLEIKRAYVSNAGEMEWADQGGELTIIFKGPKAKTL